MPPALLPRLLQHNYFYERDFSNNRKENFLPKPEKRYILLFLTSVATTNDIDSATDCTYNLRTVIYGREKDYLMHYFSHNQMVG